MLVSVVPTFLADTAINTLRSTAHKLIGTFDRSIF